MIKPSWSIESYAHITAGYFPFYIIFGSLTEYKLQYTIIAVLSIKFTDKKAKANLCLRFHKE